MSQLDVNHSKWITPATSMRSLLDLDGEDFVECAYLTILDRAPDDKGLSHYVEHLRNGKSKIDVIRALYGSEEALRNQTRISWLRWGLLRARISRFFLFRMFAIFSGRAAENSSQLLARIAELEQRINELTLAAAQSTGTDSAMSVTDPEQGSQRSSVGHDEKPDLTGKSLLTKRIYAEFAAAIAHRNHGAALEKTPNLIPRS